MSFNNNSLFLFLNIIAEIVSIVVSIRVDKIYDKKLIWTPDLEDRDSEFHQTLTYEANRAVSFFSDSCQNAFFVLSANDCAKTFAD